MDIAIFKQTATSAQAFVGVIDGKRDVSELLSSAECMKIYVIR